MKHEKAECPVCHGTFAVSVDGTMRRHPRGAPEPCPGTGGYVAGTEPTAGERVRNGVAYARATGAVVGEMIAERAAARAEPPRLVPGTYRSAEPMLEGGTPIPPGHVAISVIAYVPYDGTNGRSPSEEAALLYEDPGYLSTVLDAAPNSHVRLVMKVPPSAKPVYSEQSDPASDPGVTTGVSA